MSIPACAGCGEPVCDEIRWGDSYGLYCIPCDLKIARAVALHPSNRNVIDPDWVKPLRDELSDGAA